MSVLDRVKNHISNNRGKYGVVVGAGTAYGLSQIDPNNINPLINQAAFNTMAQGQNLALNVADKIGYGKEQLQNLGINHTISPGAIQLANDIYNSKIGQIVNPSAKNMIDSAKLDFGMKDLIGVHENIDCTITIPIKQILLENKGNEMIIQIKKILTEGNFATNDGKQARAFLPVTLIPSMAAGGAIGGIIDGLHNSNEGLLNPEPDSQIDGSLIGAGLAAPIGGFAAGVIGQNAAYGEQKRREAYLGAKMKDRENRTAYKTKPQQPNFYKGKK